MQIPLHLTFEDRSPASNRRRADHVQEMMRLNPKGFRAIPTLSISVSLVEKYLIAAGDMLAPTYCPPDRAHRRKHRPN